MDELREIQKDIHRISRDLAATQRRLGDLAPRADLESNSHMTPLQKAKKYYGSRRTRDGMFGKGDLFADPAWDIMIDLFIAAEEGKEVSVSSLCIAAAVPSTTALRWISLLEARHIIERFADPCDARRYHLALTSKAYDEISQYFETCFSFV